MLAHNARGRCWWDGSRGRTFTPVFHYTLFLCGRWQQRGSLIEWCLTWECRWSKGVSLSSSTWKKMAPIDIHQQLQNISRDQIGCEHSEMAGGVCMFHQWWQSGGNSGVEDKPHSGWPGTAVTPWNEEGFDQLVHVNQLMVVIVEKYCCVIENLLYTTVLLCSLYLW